MSVGFMRLNSIGSLVWYLQYVTVLLGTIWSHGMRLMPALGFSIQYRDGLRSLMRRMQLRLTRSHFLA